MMHNSTKVYQSQESRKSKAKDPDVNPAKTHGSYFEAPLVEKTLSTKPMSFRNVFRAIVEQHEMVVKKSQLNQHYLDLTAMQSTTMKTMSIQKLSVDGDVKKAFRRHYRIDIKDYLKRKYRKKAYEIPLESFELLRFVDEKQEKQPWKTTFVYIYKPFYINDNLKRRIQCDFDWNKQIFKYKHLPKLFRQLLKCSVQFGGLDNFIMTTSNVYMEENLQTLQINYTSFAGLALLKCKSKIGAHQYFQVLPYFTENMITTGTIGYQQRIRFFLINCLCLLTKKDFVLEAEQQVEADFIFTFDAVRNKLKEKEKIANQFQRHLSNIKGKNKKKMAQDLKIAQLIRRGLVKGEHLTWDEIVKCICVGQSPGSQGYIQQNEEYGKKIEEAFKKLHYDLLNSDPDRKFYEERNLDSELLYIPVKYQADLSLVFEKKAWWEAFNVKDKDGKMNQRMYNIFHQNFCFRLLDAVISHYYKQQQKEDDWTERFKEDPVIEILFEYLNICEYPSFIVLNQGQETEKEVPIDFKTLYDKYMNLKIK